MIAIRFKTILAACTFAACLAISPSCQAESALVGDVNLDGRVDFFDIAPFIEVLASGDYQIEADGDQNGVVNFLDISHLFTFFPGQ